MLWFQSPLLCGTVLTLLIESTVGQACQGEKCDKLYDGTNNSPTYQCFRQDFIVDGSTALEVFDAPTVSSIEEILSGYRDGTTDCQFINQFVDSEEYEATVDVEYCCDFEAHDRFTFVRFAYNALNDNRADLGFERARLPIRTFSEDRPAPTMEPVAPVVTPVMVPSPTFDNMPTTKAPSQTATTAPSKAPTISSTKSPVAVPSPTAAPVVAVTSTGRYAQVLQVPEGTNELSEEQQATFTSTIESLEFDEAITETSCSVEDQTLEGTALTVTYQCQYTGSATAPEDYSDYTVDNAEEVASTLADGGLPVEGISAVVDSPVESPVTPPVSLPTLSPIAATSSPVVAVTSIGRYAQVLQVPEGTTELSEEQQATFTSTIESLEFDEAITETTCSIEDQTLEGTALTVTYQCQYTGSATAPEDYSDYTVDNAEEVASTLADGGLPVEGISAVVDSPVESPVTPPVSLPTLSPIAATSSPVVAVTSIGRYAQVLQVPEGTTELSEEQQETFTSTIESLEFDEAITETTCSIEDQTLEGTALTVTYQCQYTGSATAPEDYSDYTVDNAEEVASTLADGGLPVEGISAVVDSPVESPVTPPVSVPTLPPNGAPVAAAVPSVAPVAEPESVSSRYVQVFQVPEGTELLDDAEQTQFTESVESLTSAFSPGTDSDCAFDDQTIEGSSLTVEYTCSYSGDGAASAPDSYVEYTRDNSPMITSALADAGLPIQSTAPVTVSPAQSAVGRYVQDFTVTEGAGELDEAQATTFERVIERQTGEFVDGLDATDCTIDDQTVTESILSVEYSCEYTGDGAENAQAAFVQFSEDTDLVTSAMAAEGLPIVDANPAIVAPIRTITAQYSQELVLQPNSVPFTAAQRGELSDYIETTAEEGLTTVETDCVVTNQDAVIESGTRSVLSLSYECSHTTSFRAVDLTMVPSEVAGLVNENLDLLVAENPSLSILEAGPMNQTLPGTAPTMAPTSAPFPDSYVTSSRVFVQTFEIPDGGSELDINEQRKLAGVVEMYANVAAESIVSGSDVESMCIVNDQSLGDDILAVEYLCEMGAEQPVSDVDLNNVQAQTEVELNKDLGIFTTEAQNAGLPIQGAKPIRLVPNEGLMGPPPVLFSDSSSGKYTQSFRVVPENESTIDFSGDQLPELESLLESYATSFVETDTAVNCQVDRQQVSAFELQDGTTSDTDSLLTVDYSCIFESEENDVTTHPQDLIKATNMDLAGFTVSAREIHSDIDETIPLEFRFDQTVASFVQNVTLAQGTGVFSQNESNLFSATISEFYAAEAPTSTVECQAKKQTPYTDSAVAIDYDCLFTATSEAVPLDNEPLQFVRKINRNLEDTADALVGSGLPIQNIDNTRATDRSFVDSARFQQVFRLSPGSTAWGSDEQIAFRDAMASLEFGPYQREASADCSLEYQSILEFDETLLAVDYLCEFEASTDPKEVAPVFGAYLNANPEQVVMALSNEGLPVEEADKVSSPDFLIPTTDETVPMMPGTHQAPEPMPTVAPQPSPVSTVPISPVNAIPTSAPVIASPTSAPVLEIPVVPSTLTPLPTPLVPTTITERYVQGFEVQEGTGEFDEEEEVAFIETIELLASEAAGGMGETNCTIDDQLIQGTVLTVEYSCVYSGTSAEAPSAFRQFTSERSAEFDSTMANAGVPILSSEPALQRESSVAFRQALTLADGVERLSNAEASEFASVASALGPIDTNTECSYTDQAPKGESLELIYLCIFTPASQTGGDIDIASAPLTFARGINRDLEGFSQLLVERGVPVESLEQTRAIGQVFSDSARFQQIVQVEEGSGKWDDDQTESFRNGMAKLDFGPYPGESSALCEVLYQSILEFDDSLLALDYTCVFSTSTDPADTAPLFGEFINANRDLVQNVLSDEGLPVEKVEKVSSPDFLLSSTNGGQPVSPASPSQAPQMESPVMLPSSTSGSQPAVPDSPSQAPQTESPVMLPAPTNGDQPAVPDSPSQAPQTESPVTVPSSTNGSQPTVLNSPSQGTLPTSTATIEFQQVFLRSDNLEVWDTNQEGIFEVEIARLMTNVEENTETECDVVFTSVLEFIPRLLSVDYSCSFASALPIQSAERFGSYINANLEFVAESLSDAGLPVERADPVSSPGLLLQPQSSATSSLAMAIDSSSRETLASWVEFVLIFVALAALN